MDNIQWYFEDLYNRLAPHIADVLGEEKTPIILNKVKIYEYTEDRKVFARLCNGKISYFDQYVLRVDFEISRSFINLVGNIWEEFAILFSYFNNDLNNPRVEYILKNIAIIVKKALNEEVLYDRGSTYYARNGGWMKNFLYKSVLTYFFCHELGHAILLYSENDRPEYREAIDFIKLNDDNLTDKQRSLWPNELAADYIALKLLHKLHAEKDVDAELLYNWTLILCLLYLYPFIKYIQEKKFDGSTHPPQHRRIGFLYEKTKSQKVKSLIEQSGEANLKLVLRIIKYVSKV